MSKVIIYRVENKNKIGPYQVKHRLTHRLNKSHSDGINHPSWGVDSLFGLMEQSSTDYRSAFISLEQLNSWFAGYLTPLFKLGFKIVSYIVDKADIIVGDSGKQIAFNINPPKRVETNLEIDPIPF